MSRTPLAAIAVAFAVGAAAGGVVGALTGRGMREPELEVLRERARDAEARAVDAEREAGEWRAVADAERLRTQAARERLAQLEVQPHAAPLAASGTAGDGDAENGSGGGHDAMQPRAPTLEIDPEMWDRARLNMEMEFLATKPDELSIKNPRFERVLRALEAAPDRGSELLRSMLSSGLGEDMKLTAAALVAAARTPGCGDVVLGLLESATDKRLRRRLLAAAARGAGEEQTGYLLRVWNDTASTPAERAIAGTGLGLRAHPVAIAVVSGEEEATPPQRARVLEGLYRRAYEREWAAAELIPVFRKALAGADGPGQTNVALGALEGYWSEAALPELDALAENTAVEPRLRQRARDAAEGIRAGRPRPPGLGELELLGRRIRQRARNSPVAPAPATGGSRERPR